MSLFTRLTATFSSGLDRLVGEIENHDAVVAAAIRDNRHAYGRARVRLGRMQDEGQRLRRRLGRLRREAASWRRRALAADDEAGAVECLRRAHALTTESDTLADTLTRHDELAQQLEREITAVRRRIEALQQRRTELRSREATADAAGRIRALESGTRMDLDETFERWEVRVTEAEVESELDPAAGYERPSSPDHFEAEIIAAEEYAALKAELDAMRRDAAQSQETDDEDHDRH